nr:nuclear transport factor 2 family protein [uncultured Sphingomonas sp.]
MKHAFLLGAAMLAASPAVAQPTRALPAAAQRAEVAAIKTVLASYKDAIEKLDTSKTERLFMKNSAIFETGGVEGTYANYLAHHLGPELREFRSFRFSDYKVDVHLLGPGAAHAVETYKYRIETKGGEIVDRIGVATSVLRKEDGRWQIAMMHNSGRKPRTP